MYQFTNSKGNVYTLNAKTVTLKNGRQQTIFYFSRNVTEFSIPALPVGRVVKETRNGLPVLSRQSL